jgi:hypothetical protein
MPRRAKSKSAWEVLEPLGDEESLLVVNVVPRHVQAHGYD